MQVGFSKQITESLVEEFFSIIISNLIKKKSVKISKFGTIGNQKLVAGCSICRSRLLSEGLNY